MAIVSSRTFRRTALTTVGALVLAMFAAPVLVHADSISMPPRTLSVSGEGEVSAVPDQAQLSAGVVSEAKTPDAALAANNSKMETVFAALKKLGIPDKMIQTSNFSVSPQYAPYDAKVPGGERIQGYQVSNTVTVRVDDEKKVGPALNALVTAGANQLGNVGFSFRDPKPLLTQARAEAVKDALAKAEAYADAAGVSLGPILSINEGGSPSPSPYPVMAMVARDKSVPIAAGESSVSANVSIVWEIK